MTLPYPPFHLATRTSSLGDETDPHVEYERLGSETKAHLLELLPADWSFADKRVLDFGCGAGRTLRHFLPEAERAEVWGAEMDVASVEWLQQHLCPPLRVVRSGAAPPLPFEDASFDFAWAISVFTHLTDNSIPWLVELHRVLKPGGFLMASYMGRYNSRSFELQPWDESQVGMNVLRHNNPWDDGGPVVFMSDWWVEAHWGRGFQVVKTTSVHGQTWALLRKRDVALTVDDVERPTDDVREVLALRNNLRQVRAELEWNQAVMRASASWRLTAPLRKTAALAREVRHGARQRRTSGRTRPNR